MKQWHYALLGLFVGVALTAILFITAAPPRGEAVDLQPAPSPAPIFVHVDGAVLNPGVYSLPRESRVQEAIKAAGGLAPLANQAAINLAARLRDGEKLSIPIQGTPVVIPSQLGNPLPESADGSPPADGPINLNSATAEELETLSGIGPTRAADIIEYRQAHGDFKSIEEIQEVPGIGPATFERLKDQITVD